MHLQQARHRPWVTCWNMCRHRPLIALTAQVCISRGRSPSEVGRKQQILHGSPSMKESNSTRAARQRTPLTRWAVAGRR